MHGITPRDRSRRDEIVTLVQRLHAARVVHDEQAFLDLFDENVVMNILGDPAHLYPFPSRRFGKHEVTDLFKLIEIMFEYANSEILNLTIEGDRAAMLRKVDLVHRGSGRSGTVHVANWLDFRGKKIVRIDQLTDNAALAPILGNV